MTLLRHPSKYEAGNDTTRQHRCNSTASQDRCASKKCYKRQELDSSALFQDGIVKFGERGEFFQVDEVELNG